MNKLTPLSDLGMLEAAIAESRNRPVLLFKHSRLCGISCEALDELRNHVAACAADVIYRMITVQSHRDVSDGAARTLGIRHETPQAILVKDGQPVWSASHFRITAAELRQAVAAQANTARPAPTLGRPGPDPRRADPAMS